MIATRRSRISSDHLSKALLHDTAIEIAISRLPLSNHDVAFTKLKFMADPCVLYATGEQVRLAARSGTLTTPTTGLAPGHLQANLLVLPSDYAEDFRLLCQRNLVPCPLLAESASPGDFSTLRSHIPGLSGPQIARNLDLRHDAPGYTIYADARRIQDHGPRLQRDISDVWSDQHIAFLIGRSFSFEAALTRNNLPVTHVQHGRNVPMYRTSIPLCNSARFQNRTYVVSMRPYALGQIKQVRAVTRPYTLTHGEPLCWGWDRAREIGIVDVGKPDYGDAPVSRDGTAFEEGKTGDEIPVFWGCGVTPQNAVLGGHVPGLVMGHLPGHMIVLDLKEEDVFGT